MPGSAPMGKLSSAALASSRVMLLPIRPPVLLLQSCQLVVSTAQGVSTAQPGLGLLLPPPTAVANKLMMSSFTRELVLRAPKGRWAPERDLDQQQKFVV